MKRIIFIEILLSFVLGVLLSVVIMSLQNITNTINWYNTNLTYISWEKYAEEIQFTQTITRVIFYFLATLANLAAIVLIAIKDFPVFKPLLNKLEANKQKRAHAKAERAEADKQAKIKALESELEELKKD